MQLDYHIVDVFTDTPLKGNPLAVVMDTASLSTDRMQAIAREFNLSETTFIQRRPSAVEQAEGIRVRIFTTQEELNFAGHPTLGTASILKLHAPETLRGRTIILAENVGPVPVRFPGDSLYAEMTQRDPVFGAELDREKVAGLIGLTPADLHPALEPQIVSTGTEFAIVSLHSADALSRLAVRHREAMDWLRPQGARWFFVLAPDPNPDPIQSENGTKCYRARMQFYGGEDPATGSAAGCAIAYLVHRGAVASEQPVHLRQGIEIGRPSDLFLSARSVLNEEYRLLLDARETVTTTYAMENSRVTDVRVAGSTVPVANGHLFLL